MAKLGKNKNTKRNKRKEKGNAAEANPLEMEIKKNSVKPSKAPRMIPWGLILSTNSVNPVKDYPLKS